jgi:nicotinamide mononucleotide transporter PnuC
MNNITWFTTHWIEIFGAITGILYVFLEIRKSIWLWPVGIITSAIYVSVFFTSKFYADMGLQIYYVVISFYGFYVWRYGTGAGEKVDTQVPTEDSSVPVKVTHTPLTIIWQLVVHTCKLHRFSCGFLGLIHYRFVGNCNMDACS